MALYRFFILIGLLASTFYSLQASDINDPLNGEFDILNVAELSDLQEQQLCSNFNIITPLTYRLLCKNNNQVDDMLKRNSNVHRIIQDKQGKRYSALDIARLTGNKTAEAKLLERGAQPAK